MASPGRPPSGRVLGGHGGSSTVRGGQVPRPTSGQKSCRGRVLPRACRAAAVFGRGRFRPRSFSRASCARRYVNEAPLLPCSCGPVLVAAGEGEGWILPFAEGVGPNATVSQHDSGSKVLERFFCYFRHPPLPGPLALCSWESVGRSRSQLQTGLCAGLVMGLGGWGGRWGVLASSLRNHSPSHHLFTIKVGFSKFLI